MQDEQGSTSQASQALRKPFDAVETSSVFLRRTAATDSLSIRSLLPSMTRSPCQNRIVGSESETINSSLTYKEIDPARLSPMINSKSDSLINAIQTRETRTRSDDGNPLAHLALQSLVDDEEDDNYMDCSIKDIVNRALSDDLLIEQEISKDRNDILQSEDTPIPHQQQEKPRKNFQSMYQEILGISGGECFDRRDLMKNYLEYKLQASDAKQKAQYKSLATSILPKKLKGSQAMTPPLRNAMVTSLARCKSAPSVRNIHRGPRPVIKTSNPAGVGAFLKQQQSKRNSCCGTK